MKTNIDNLGQAESPVPLRSLISQLLLGLDEVYNPVIVVIQGKPEHQNTQEIQELLSQMSLSIWCKIERMILDKILTLISLVETDLIKMDSVMGTTLMAIDMVEKEVTNLHIRYVENMAT